MRFNPRFFVAAFGATLLISGASAQTVVASSTFDADDDGWQVREYNNNTNTFLAFDAPDYFSTGGNPGGHIGYTDTVPGGWWYYAPAKYLGDKSLSYGQRLSFDLKWVGGDSVGNNGPDVVLYDGTTHIRTQFTYPTDQWASYNATLSETGWHKTNAAGTADNGVVTAAEFQTVLGNLQELRIRGDWRNPLGDASRLDNVQLEAVPEPTTIAALGLGALALLRRNRK
jgi:hypothetical protein